MITPNQFEKILGKTFVTRANAPLFVFDGNTYTKYDLARIGIPHAHAAVKLDLLLRRLSITDTDTLARRVHEIPNIKGMGHTVFLVALAICDQKKRVKEAVTTWNAEAVRAQKKDGETPLPVTFATMKSRVRRKALARKSKTTKPQA